MDVTHQSVAEQCGALARNEDETLRLAYLSVLVQWESWVWVVLPQLKTIQRQGRSDAIKRLAAGVLQPSAKLFPDVLAALRPDSTHVLSMLQPGDVMQSVLDALYIALDAPSPDVAGQLPEEEESGADGGDGSHPWRDRVFCSVCKGNFAKGTLKLGPSSKHKCCKRYFLKNEGECPQRWTWEQFVAVMGRAESEKQAGRHFSSSAAPPSPSKAGAGAGKQTASTPQNSNKRMRLSSPVAPNAGAGKGGEGKGKKKGGKKGKKVRGGKTSSHSDEEE